MFLNSQKKNFPYLKLKENSNIQRLIMKLIMSKSNFKVKKELNKL